jgi:hypothetical protein
MAINAELPDFLRPFRASPDELVHFRAMTPRNAPVHLVRDFPTQEKPPASIIRVAAYPNLTADSNYLKEYRALNKKRGFYFVVNPGGDSDLDVKRFVATFSESDPPEGANIDEFLAKERARESPAPPSVELLTYKSIHRHWLIDGPCSREEWLKLQQGQIAYYHSDATIMNESRVMRLPSFNHVRVDYVKDCLLYKPIELITFEPERKYSVASLQAAFPVGAEGLLKVYEKLTRPDYKKAEIEPTEELRREVEAIRKQPRSSSAKTPKDNTHDKITTLAEVLKRERAGEELKRLKIETADYGESGIETSDAGLIEGTIARMCLQLANAEQGKKDNTLLHCAKILYGLVKGELADKDRIDALLLDAVALAGERDPQFDPMHAEQTMRNAYNYVEATTLVDLRSRNGVRSAPEEPPPWLDDAPNWSDPQTPANAATAGKIQVDVALSRIVTAQTILTTHYPEPKWAVKGLIPEGVTFIAGPPKLGKSIFALNLAVAVAEGGRALSHFDVERGAVLYLALEDGPRRIQERLLKLTNGQISDKLEVVTDWPRLNQGGLEAIEAWIDRHKDARLLIVDTLKMLRPLATGRDRNAYDADYEAIQPLTKVASQRVALCVVHHTRKAIAEDPLATVSGSYGLTGAADGVLVLSRRRNRSDATLSVIGRDVEEQELALEFKPDMCLWSALGKAEDVRRSSERQQVLDLLRQTGEPMAPAEIAEHLDKQPVSTRTLLFKMREKREIAFFGKKYQLPDFQPPAQNVPSVPKAEKTGNARKAQNENGLDAERSHVPNVPNNSQKQAEEEKAQSVDGLGTRERSEVKANGASGLGAFPAKNVPGNAGNVRKVAI